MIRFALSAVFFALSGTFSLQAQRVAFGSCSRHNLENQLWTEVLAEKPTHWIWAGDNVYADTHDMSKMAAMYQQQKSRPAYQQLRNQATIYGTWDDHDYGVNDGGKYFSKKKESKEELLRFLDVPENAEVRKHEGVYQSYTSGKGNKKIKIIILDTRYFRDTLRTSSEKGRRYDINPEGDILGEDQWSWLKGELESSDAGVNIIVSSIQFIANEHGYEKWGNFPKARQRMLDLLAAVKSPFTFFISGDRHIAEVSRMEIPGLTYPLYDITSSGLTHTWSIIGSESNSARVGALIAERNFGLLDITWKKNKPKVNLKIVGPVGRVLLQQNLN